MMKKEAKRRRHKKPMKEKKKRKEKKAQCMADMSSREQEQLETMLEEARKDAKAFAAKHKRCLFVPRAKRMRW